MAEQAELPNPDAGEAERLFEQLLLEPAAERELHLDELCRERPDLERELRALQADWDRALRALEALNGSSATEAAWAPALLAAEPGFEDRGLLGRGGMGEVRAVWDPLLERTLALKRLLTAAPGRARAKLRRARFLAEARITGGLQHPGIVPVHALGSDAAGTPYYTMPLVEGEDLGQVFERVRRQDPDWPLSRAIEVIVRVCDAMAYAHSRGVVHRDLKPANIRIGRFGEVYVMDWGLAKVRGEPDARDIRPRAPAAETQAQGAPAERELRTMDGDVIGTPGYMSPEQAEGRGEEVGALSDVYSVGCMLYQLLTGAAPYADTSGKSRSALEVLALVRAGPPPPASALAPHASHELAAICERAMQREPLQRYPSMDELARDLRAFCEGRVVRAYHTGSWAQLRKWIGRNRGLSAALAAAVLAALGGSIGIAWVQTRASERLRDTNQSLERTNLELVRAQGVAEDRLDSLRRSLYCNNVALAQHALESFNTANLRALLQDCDPDLRGWEWRYLERLADSSLATLRGHFLPVTAVGFDPVGRWLVSASEDRTLRLWRLPGGEPLARLAGHTDIVEDLAVSPDGQSIASVGRDRTLRLWDVHAGLELACAGPCATTLSSVAFSPDGMGLLTGDAKGGVQLWYAGSLTEAGTLAGHESIVLAVAFSPDGRLAAAGGFDGSLLLWDLESGSAPRALLARGGRAVRGCLFTPDGRQIAATSADGLLRIFDVASGEVLARLFSRSGSESIALSPDGLTLYAAELGALQAWDTSTSRRGPAWLGHDGGIVALGAAPGGRLIASGGVDGTVRLWDATRDPACNALPIPDPDVHALAFSTDSRCLAWGGRLGRIEVIDALSGTRRVGWQAGQGWVMTLAFHPDGERLLSGGLDGSICLWDLERGELRGMLRGHTKTVRAIALDAGGRRALSASEDGSACLWDLASLRQIARFQSATGFLSVELDPNDDRAVTCDWQGHVRVLDLRTGCWTLDLAAHPGVGAVATFSPDGRRILSGGADRWLRVWDARDGRLLLAAVGHESSVTRVSFFPDGERLCTCGWDGLLKIWDAQDARPILTLSAPESLLRALAVSPDGQIVAAAGQGGHVRLWSAAR